MRIILLSFLFAFGDKTFSQDSLFVLSNYEKFANTTGRILKSETVDIGTIKNLYLSVARSKDIKSGDTASAVTIAHRYGIFSYTDSVLITIDMNEMQQVNQALNYFQYQVKEKKAITRTQYSYVTSNDVAIICDYNPSKNFSWSVSFSRRYHESKATIPNTVCFIKGNDINELVEIMNRAADVAKSF